MYNRKYGKMVPQYSWYAETYDYDRYRQFFGVTPGYSIDENHLEVGYNKELGNSNVNLTVYGDLYKFQDYQVVSDSMYNVTFKPDGSGNPVIDEDGKVQQYHYLHHTRISQSVESGGRKELLVFHSGETLLFRTVHP